MCFIIIYRDILGNVNIPEIKTHAFVKMHVNL